MNLTPFLSGPKYQIELQNHGLGYDQPGAYSTIRGFGLAQAMLAVLSTAYGLNLSQPVYLLIGSQKVTRTQNY